MEEMNRILFFVLLIGLFYALYRFKNLFFSTSEDIEKKTKNNQQYLQKPPQHQYPQYPQQMGGCPGGKCSLRPPTGMQNPQNQQVQPPKNNCSINDGDITEDNISQIDIPSLNNEDPTDFNSLLNTENDDNNDDFPSDESLF